MASALAPHYGHTEWLTDKLDEAERVLPGMVRDVVEHVEKTETACTSVADDRLDNHRVILRETVAAIGKLKRIKVTVELLLEESGEMPTERDARRAYIESL